MPYDEYGNWSEDPQQPAQPAGPYKPTDDEWNKASTYLNQYNDKNGGGNINWDNARKTFEQQAAGGGNFGDWVNKTYDAHSGWSTPKNGGFQPPTSPTTAWNREEFRDKSMARPTGMSAGDFITQGGYGDQVKFVPGSKDKVILPSGEVIDLSINANAQGQGTANGWTGDGNWNGSAVVPYANSGGVGAAGAPGAAGSSGAGSAVIDPLRQQLLDTLSKRSQQSLAIDRNDPIIRAQADAFGANEERSKRNYLADLAEKLGPNANLRGETRMANERVGQSTGGYEAELMGRELTARRTEIADALTQMRGMLTTEQEIQLRKELAQMDDAIQRMKLQQDSSQFGATLGYQQAALAQQGQIANNNLGYNYDALSWETSPLNPRNILPA